MEKNNGNQGGSNQDPKDNGNQGGKNQDPKDKGDGQGGDENVKALQRKLSEKDSALKKAQKELDDHKKSSSTEISDLTAQISRMNEFIEGQKKEKEMEILKEKYPDVSPTLLINVPEDKREEVVEQQREINKKQFGDSKYFQTPEYSSIEEIDERIKAIKDDKSINAEDASMEVMKLERLKRNFG